MVALRSRLSWHSKSFRDDDRQPRLRIPLVPTLVGMLALVNIASAVLALAQ